MIFEEVPEYLLAVDPGKRYAGVAMFERGRLQACARPNPCERGQPFFSAPAENMVIHTGEACVEWANEMADDQWHVATEWMLARGASFKTTSLMELCGLAGYMAGACTQTSHMVKILDWKSTYPKKRFHPWIIAELDDLELEILCEATGRTANQLMDANHATSSDIVDAVGIGLFCLGRDSRKHKV